MEIARVGLGVTIWERFLAMLDSVSRAHGMGLLSIVRPSVRQSSRPCRNYDIISEPIILSNFGCGFPWAIRLEFFKKKKQHIFRYSAIFFRFR